MTLTEAVAPAVPTETTDWRALFRAIETEGGVPNASEQIIDRQHALFRSLYVDLGEAKAAIAASRLDPPVVTIYADVLNIPESTTWLLEGAALVVIARRVQIGPVASVALNFDAPSAGSLVFFADEIEGSLKVVARVKGQPALFRIDAPPPGGGVQIRLVDGAAKAIALSRAQGLPAIPHAGVQRAFTTEFLVAALLFDQQPRVSLQMLSWLKRWAGSSAGYVDVFLRASSLLAHLAATLDAGQNGAAFVPYLSRAVYADLAGAFVREAQQFESEYRTLATHRVVNGQFIELARRLAKQQVYQSQFVDKLVEQARANHEHAMNAVSASEKNFDAARKAVQMLEADFKEIGIPQFRQKVILEGLISLAGALVTFAVGIGGVIVTGGAAGGAAAAGAIDTAKAVEKTAEAGSKLAETARKSGDVMAKLKKAGAGLGKLYTFVMKIIDVAGKIDGAGRFAAEMKDLELSGLGSELTATYEWEIFKLTTAEAMKDPVEQGVGYASELQTAVGTLAIHGQSVVAAKLAAITTGQQYANALLQRELARQQQKNLDEYVEQLQAGQAPAAELMQQLYQRYVDTKSSLYAALLGYRAAYAYWALQPSRIQPRIVDSVDAWDTGLRDLTSISLDNATALHRFKPQPQKLVSKRIVVDDPKVLAELRSERRATWNIPLDLPALAGFDRVRLNRVRIWLQGAKPDASGSVTMVVSTAGSYLDRRNGTRYQFAAHPLERQLQYRVSKAMQTGPDWRFDDGTYGTIEVDGVVDEEVRYAYFEPTPFAQWALRLGKGSTVDVSAVTRITMEVSGSIMTNLPAAEVARRVHAEQ